MVRSSGAQELFPVSSCFFKPIRFANSLDNLFFFRLFVYEKTMNVQQLYRMVI